MKPGELRRWVNTSCLPDDYLNQSFLLVEPKPISAASALPNRSTSPRDADAIPAQPDIQAWWILMGGEMIWEFTDIIELDSDVLGEDGAHNETG